MSSGGTNLEQTGHFIPEIEKDVTLEMLYVSLLLLYKAIHLHDYHCDFLIDRFLSISNSDPLKTLRSVSNDTDFWVMLNIGSCFSFESFSTIYRIVLCYVTLLPK